MRGRNPHGCQRSTLKSEARTSKALSWIRNDAQGHKEVFSLYSKAVTSQLRLRTQAWRTMLNSWGWFGCWWLTYLMEVSLSWLTYPGCPPARERQPWGQKSRSSHKWARSYLRFPKASACSLQNVGKHYSHIQIRTQILRRKEIGVRVRIWTQLLMQSSVWYISSTLVLLFHYLIWLWIWCWLYKS